MKRWIVTLLLLCTLPGWAQPPAEKDKATHDALRAMKDQCVEALNKGDFDAVLALCDDEIVFTPMDAHLSHGKTAVKAYLDGKLKGPSKVVDGFSTEVTVDRLTTLYGQTFGVATGTSVSHYKLVGGKSFDVENRWTATVVKKGDQWLLASFQSTADVFNNPLLDSAKKTTGLLGLVAGIAGLLLGAAVGRLSKR